MCASAGSVSEAATGRTKAVRHVIVGGGQAALSGAERLRALDPEGDITILSEEATLPYQRPPLSKAYLKGELPVDRLVLRPRDWFDEHRIGVELSTRVSRIDRHEKIVETEGAGRFAYDRLLLATGSVPRTLPLPLGGGLGGVYPLRTRDDSDDMAHEFADGRRLLVVGGGYIGLEVAAVARAKGVDVTVLEMAPRILERVAAAETSDYFRALHTSHGVDIREGTTLARLTGADRVDAAQLADGTRLPIDFAVVGIGILPSIDLAVEAGLDVDGGIVVDDRCRTCDPDIFAAGDCAAFPFAGHRTRLESVPNAIHQAETAAANMSGGDEDYVATPWFWSDQYDVKLQIAGLNRGYDSTIVRPGRREGAQSVWYYRDDRLIAVDAMNDAPAFMVARKLIESGRSIAPSEAADPGHDLRGYMKP